jgi:hypothetical protein
MHPTYRKGHDVPGARKKIKAMDAKLKINTSSSRIKRRCSNRILSRLERITHC